MKKFLFDQNDFDKNRPSTDVPIYTEDQLLLAKKQAVAQGKAEGLKEARQSQEEYMAQCLTKIVNLAEKIAADEERRETEKCIAATKLTMKITHKLLPQFAQKFALEEIEKTIIDSLDMRRDEPRIAVTVPTAHLETLKGKIDALALEKGYAGKIILLADDALPPSDCRVEWADGGAERLYERLFLQIEGEFAKAISGMNTALEETGAKKIPDKQD
jgi:flagellar assembly protein FliH